MPLLWRGARRDDTDQPAVISSQEPHGSTFLPYRLPLVFRDPGCEFQGPCLFKIDIRFPCLICPSSTSNSCWGRICSGRLIPQGRTVRHLGSEVATNKLQIQDLDDPAIMASSLLHQLGMWRSLPVLFLLGLLSTSCDAARVTLHGSHDVKPVTNRLDLLLMANERQVVHYRYLAAEQVGAASRLAEGGDVAGTTEMLFSAIEYQALAEEIEEQTADRRITEVSASAGQREP